LQLLRLRDGKVRGMKSQGHLLGLGELANKEFSCYLDSYLLFGCTGRELMAAAKLEGGYPDSDDEDDGEEEDSDDEEDDDDEDGGDGEEDENKNADANDRGSVLRQSLSRARKNGKQKKKIRFDASTPTSTEDGYFNDDADNSIPQNKPRLGDGHVIRSLFRRKSALNEDVGDGRKSEMRQSESRTSRVSPTKKQLPANAGRRNNMDIFIRFVIAGLSHTCA
jgi:hypothetical protein